MHIEPGIVDASKIGLSYGTAAVCFLATAKVALDQVKAKAGFSLLLKAALSTLVIFFCFQVLPHQPVGISEVHLIMGSTLFLVFGMAPAAIGLALGLLMQGVLFAPLDLPQYFMNVSTLIFPLLMLGYVAKRVIPETIAYQEVSYTQVLKLSATYQAGIVSWVMFWALYGQGFTAENLVAIGSFGAAYLSVILIEPIIDLAALAIAKRSVRLRESGLIQARVYTA